MILLGDIGGSRIRIAACENDRIEPLVVCDTPADFAAGLDAITRLTTAASDGRTPEALIIGIAGVLAPDHAKLLYSPHLSKWEGQDIVAQIGSRLGCPVFLENDAALGALGEAVSGDGQETGIVAYVAVGTGIGGARVVNGTIDHAAIGFEPGHQYLFIDGAPKEAEQLVSGSAIEARFGFPAEELADAAAWTEYARLFAYALYNTILHWSPDRVILGGSLFAPEGTALTVETVREQIQKINTVLPQLPEFSLASHGAESGIYGARAYAHIKGY